MRHRCLTDIAGPFYDTTKPFRNWSALPFYQLDLPDRPYVDQPQLAQGLDRALAGHRSTLEDPGPAGRPARPRQRRAGVLAAVRCAAHA